MTDITKVVTAAGMLEMVSQTEIARKVIDEVASKASDTADFLEDLEKAIQEDNI